MQQPISCPDEIKINPNGYPSEMPKDSDDVQLNSPPVPNKSPDKNNTHHGMTLRRTPALSQSRCCKLPATPKTLLDVPPKSRSGNNRLLSDSNKHAGQPSQTTLKVAANVASGDPSLHRPSRKRKKPYNRKKKTTDSVPSSLGVQELDIDSSSISLQFTDHLLESTPITIKTGAPKQNYTPDSSVHDPLPLSVSPLRYKPEVPQSSSPFNTPLKVVSQCCVDSRGERQKSQTTLQPNQGSSGIKHESSPTSSKASTPLDQLSQHESQLSSDLSIEFSLPEEELINISLEEDEKEDEDDEELPSYLLEISKKPACIKEGDFVWCKFRLFPFWPAVVKSVKQKSKKASIIWIDMPTIDKKRKGFCVSLRNLKTFDCEEAKQLVCAAKENYAAVIDWALELINDYVFRIACSSFTGSFIEYSSHFMSNPVRRKYPQGWLDGLALPSSQGLEEHRQRSSVVDSDTETLEEGGPGSKRLLPDRSVAAHNRANEKLVHFIVSQHMVDQHLLAVIRGNQPSRWLRSFLKASRRLQVKDYLEDDKQLDQVYNYLKELFDNVTDHAPCLANVKFMDDVRFVLDVLLPEATISAIAGVDNISLNKAEEKYLNGRCVSDREREEFELTIGQQMR